MKKVSFMLFVLLLLSGNMFSQSIESLEKLVYSKNKTFSESIIQDKYIKYTKEDLEEIINSIPLNENGSFAITEVDTIQGLSMQELHKIANQFVADAFVSANNVIQMNDPVGGIIICKGIITGNAYFKDGLLGKYGGEENVSFTLKIQCKDNRYKLDLYDLNIKRLKDNFHSDRNFESDLNMEKYSRKAPFNTKHYANLRTQFIYSELGEILSIKNMIKKYFSNNSSQNKDSDW